MSQIAASRRQRHWDLRAAGNFVGGGTGAGLVVVAALAAMTGAPFRLALALGIVSVVAGLSLVWLEIGKPWRALNVFFHPQTSWMTREGIMASLLVPCGLFAVGWGSMAAAVAAGGGAAGFLYCQARMLRAARAIPAWRQAEIVPFLLATGLAEGSGAYVVVGSHEAGWLAVALAAGLLREAAWLAYRAGLARTPAAETALAVLGGPPARWVRGGQVAGLVLLALALAPVGVAASVTQVMAVSGGTLALLSGWGMKVVLITRAGFTRAVTIPATPTRGSEGSYAR